MTIRRRSLSAYVNVEVDLDDVLPEISTEDLRGELKLRGTTDDGVLALCKEALFEIYRGAHREAQSILERAVFPVFTDEDDARARYEQAMCRKGLTQ